MCFDPATGYVALIVKDQEKVAYEGWKQIGSQFVAGTVRKSFGKHLLFEAKLTGGWSEVAADAFAVPAGATQQPAGVRIDEQRGLVFAKGSTSPGASAQKPQSPIAMVSGQAVVRIWVDEKGLVSKAVVEDADDKESADAGFGRATLLVYAPDVENGKPAKFETSYTMRSMGGGGMGIGRGRPGMGAPGMDGGGDAPRSAPSGPPTGAGGPGGM